MRGARRRLRFLDRFIKREDGAAAVEFAIVSMPFFALLFAITETALVFFAGQVMETGLTNAARQVRTGQAQDFSKEEFKQVVCDQIFGLFDCEADLVVDVRTLEQFSDANFDKPIEDGEFTFDPEFDPGNGEEIVVVRAFIEWPTIVPAIVEPGKQSGLTNGNRLLAAAAVFRNEPFDP